MSYFGAGLTTRSDRRYIATAMSAPLLERDHEAMLARRWRQHGDEAALHELTESYARLVVRVASRFRSFGLPIGDLVQEGNVGLMEAAARFDPSRNVRFSTYAVWWVTARIQEYILRNWSIVRMGTTSREKRLFFNFRRVRARIAANVNGGLTDDDRRRMAEDLGVTPSAVDRMAAHLSHSAQSLNVNLGRPDGDELQDLLVDPSPSPEEIVIDERDGAKRATWLRTALDRLTPRERHVISHRFLTSQPSTLAEIGKGLGVTKERIRQIEARALAKLRGAVLERADVPVHALDG